MPIPNASLESLRRGLGAIPPGEIPIELRNHPQYEDARELGWG